MPQQQQQQKTFFSSHHLCCQTAQVIGIKSKNGSFFGVQAEKKRETKNTCEDKKIRGDYGL